MVIEIIGICATIMILVSMSFKTLSFKGSLLMRITNIIGSIIFVVYGSLLPAISTAVLNAALVIINTYHLITLVLSEKKKNSEEAKTEASETKGTKEEVSEKKE